MILIACNNAKGEVKDFSGCVTGVIITMYTILDLMASARELQQPMMYISNLYFYATYIVFIMMWEIWVVMFVS